MEKEGNHEQTTDQQQPSAPEILRLLQHLFKNRASVPHFPIAADHYDTLMEYTLAIQEYRKARGEHPTRTPIFTRGPGHKLQFADEGFTTVLVRREDLHQPIPENWGAKLEVGDARGRV